MKEFEPHQCPPYDSCYECAYQDGYGAAEEDAFTLGCIVGAAIVAWGCAMQSSRAVIVECSSCHLRQWPNEGFDGHVRCGRCGSCIEKPCGSGWL